LYPDNSASLPVEEDESLPFIDIEENKTKTGIELLPLSQARFDSFKSQLNRKATIMVIHFFWLFPLTLV
jgi:hypothetical protein